MGLARGLVRGTVRGLVRGLVRSRSDPLALAFAYYYSKASDGQTITEQRGLGAPNGTNGPTVAVESSDAYYAPYVAADGAYVDIPGTTSNYVIYDYAAEAVIADPDAYIRVKVKHRAATAGFSELVSSRLGAVGCGTLRYAASSAALNYLWFESGTARQATSSNHGVADGWVGYFRATLIEDNGSGTAAVLFQKSSDGVNWTDISQNDATGGSGVANPTTGAAWRIGGSTNYMLGSVFEASVAVGGVEIMSFNAASFGNSLTYPDPVSGQIVTLNQSTTGRPAFVVDESTFEAGGSDKLLLFPTDPAYGIGAGAEFAYVGRFSIPAAVVDGGFLAATCDSSKNEGWSITVSTAGYLTATIDEGANRDTATGSISVLGKNSVAVALVVTATTLSVYADGVLHASVARTAGAVPAGLMRVFTSGGVTAGGFQRGGWFGHEVQSSAPTIAQQLAVAAKLEQLNRTGGPA